MPFCPKCRDEFQDWVEICPDCKVKLVDKLEPLPEKPPSIIPLRPPPEPTKSIVPVATFFFPAEAYIAVTKLESEGIWAFVADENIGRIYSGAFGGIKVNVREEDAKKAKKILRPMIQKDEKNKYIKKHAASLPNENKCPKCHSTNIQYETYNIRVIYLIMVILGIMFPFFKRKWKCNTCGYQWKNVH